MERAGVGGPRNAAVVAKVAAVYESLLTVARLPPDMAIRATFRQEALAVHVSARAGAVDRRAHLGRSEFVDDASASST